MNKHLKFVTFLLSALLLSACQSEQSSNYDIKNIPFYKVKNEYVLSGDFLFDFNKSDLTDDGKVTLDRIAQELRANNIKNITVAGYTDRLGSDAYNVKLSQARADVSKAYLLSQYVNANITAIGKGSANQVKACNNETGQALRDCLKPNRRVVITTR